MSYFVTASDLNSELGNIFEYAEEKLIIISPYIKLHERFKSILKTKLDNPDLNIVVVFGKNEHNISKSMNLDDFEFFKQFSNIEIRHEKRLHAKIFANEKEVLITSMNLYDYSQDTNIESGIISKVSDKNIGGEAIGYFDRVIKQAELLFKKIPAYKKKNFGLTSEYITSNVEIDKTVEFFSTKRDLITDKKNKKPVKNLAHNKKKGYCIRTGKEIPFNIKKPYIDSAFKSWKIYENEEYAEKYCHFSGELSKGETNMKKPILKRNWKKAMN